MINVTNTFSISVDSETDLFWVPSFLYFITDIAVVVLIDLAW